jgi:hypothetical protein
MSKLNKTPRKPVDADTDAWYRQVAQQVNALSEGQISASYNALTAAPASGTWVQGDFVKNRTPTELGAALSRYVIVGWVCVASGTPGTWVQARFLTGN